MYYFLRQNLFQNLNMIDFVPPVEIESVSAWVEGRTLVMPSRPLVCTLLPEYGSQFPDFFDTTLPVMSNRLIRDLQNLGVSNLEQCSIIFRNVETSEEYNDHSLVNFIGTYDAIDLAKTKHRKRFNKPYFEGPIYLDPKKIGPLEAFRLSCGPTQLVVSERIATELKKGNYRALSIQKTEDYN